MREEKNQYLYGPVPSRRLGRSLGVDIVPFKVCTLDCIYCQLGKTTEKTTERKEYVPADAVLAELRPRLAQGLDADFITISGSGEPTLNLKLGRIIDEIKKITDIPVAVLTNGTLLGDKSVRADCAGADLILPSLDGADAQTFERINHPDHNISIENVISGLCALRNEFAGRIWLEVFLIEGINTSREQIADIKAAAERIGPDKIQLNTAVRPTAEPGVNGLGPKKLAAIAKRIGENCEVIADFSPSHAGKPSEAKAEYLLSMLKRRPCSLTDICHSLGIVPNEALKYISRFQKQQLVRYQRKNGKIFFMAD